MGGRKVGLRARAFLGAGWRATPPAVDACLAGATEPALHGLAPLVGLPEHRVELGDGRRGSQTDLLVLARSADKPGPLVVLAVEGKESEPFGNDTVAAWLDKTRTGADRLRLVLEAIGLERSLAVEAVCYQLLHRAAAAVLEARRFGAAHAVMVVHSFSETKARLGDYQAFLGLYERSGGADELVELARLGDVVLHAAWVGDTKQPARGPFEGLQIAEDAIGWLRRHYREQTFYCERDVEAVLQRRMLDLISEQRLSGLRVRRNRWLHGAGIRKQLDLVVEDASGAVVLAMEVKYEPATERPDLARRDGGRPDPVTSGSEIRADFAVVEGLVRDGDARSAVAMLVDEGSRLSQVALAGPGNWETWDELARGKPDWLRPQVLRAAFG